MITRRTLLKGLAALPVGGVGLGGYALAEPFRLNVTRYTLRPKRWTPGLKLRVAVIADLHVCEPWMGLERVQQIAARTQALAPDIVLLLGDYVPSHGLQSRWRATRVADKAWTSALANIKAPLGVHAVLGNHDWWDEPELQRTRRTDGTAVGRALQNAGIQLYENRAIPIMKGGHRFWLAGLGDQWAFWLRRSEKRRGQKFYLGVDDLDGTLAQVDTDDPVLLMAHEPDIFPKVPDRISLTLSGHTHGGQLRFFGYAPVVPSRYGRRYDYGHIQEGGRDLIVSAGLGVSGVPMRFGMPPEIVVLDLG